MSTVFNFTFVPWFRSVAPYIHMHRGKTFVVGIAGEAIAAGKLQNLAQDLALIQSMGVKIVLVHGFRPQVNEQLAANDYVAGANFSVADITAAVAVDFARVVKVKPDERHPHLLRWRERLAQRPSFSV